jgi:hypothetical protein
MDLYVLFFQVFCIYEVTFCLKYGMSSEMLLYVKVRLWYQWSVTIFSTIYEVNGL